MKYGRRKSWKAQVYVMIAEKFSSVAAQMNYETDINKEYVIKGNAAVLKCIVPSYLLDYLEIISWMVDDDEMNYNDKNYGRLTSLYKEISLKSFSIIPLVLNCFVLQIS